MKKLLFFAAIACLLLLSACGAGTNTSAATDYVPYNEIPENYTLEAAKADGLVVYEDYDITAGQSAWDGFVAETERENTCAVRLLFYYTLEGQGITPAHEDYEEIQDDYPGYYIQDLSFDGAAYTLYWVEGAEEYTRTYDYLKRLEDDTMLRYVLVNDDTVTWDALLNGMFSSRFGDWIDFQTVYVNER